MIWDADATGGNGAQDGAGSWTPGTTVTFYNGATDVIGATTDIVFFTAAIFSSVRAKWKAKSESRCSLRILFELETYQRS